ncbi:MAG: Eco57I restriction-modification methylase domain-containing protein [Candidatus Methanoplasma sp.]|nr:Eco57I restriction-modification methylase domain-containing protein [Candidatus Methanoplasma sp.]
MLDVSGYTSDKDLGSVRLLEPSCGCGAFLSRITERLCESAQRFDRPPCDLLKSITAFDIDGDSVAKSRILVSEVLESHGWGSRDAGVAVGEWVRQSDFLLANTRGYGLVIGNPPYVRSSNIPRELRRRYIDAFETLTFGTDLFVGFIEAGLKSLSSDGRLCYICADRWMQNSYGKKLRKFIVENHHMDLICKMHETDAFENKVGAYPAIILVNGSSETKYVDCSKQFSPSDVAALRESALGSTINTNGNFTTVVIPSFKKDGSPWTLANRSVLDWMRKTEGFPVLEESGVNMGIGVATGEDEVFITDDGDLVESDIMVPLLCNSDIKHNVPPKTPSHWLVNPWDRDGTLVDLDLYPMLRSYFESNRGRLEDRHVARKNSQCWYRTIDKVKPWLRASKKLLFSDMALRSEPVLDNGSYYPDHNLYWMTSDTWDLEVLGGILMSEQTESVLDAVGVKMRGRTMRFQAQYLRMLRVPFQSDMDESVRNDLKEAFCNRDRVLATKAAAEAYGAGAPL